MQPQVGVVLERLEDRPLRLGERARAGAGCLGQRPREGGAAALDDPGAWRVERRQP